MVGRGTPLEEGQHRRRLRNLTATRWSTTLPSKVNLPHAIDFRALCGTVTSKLTRKSMVNETFELHCAGGWNAGHAKLWLDAAVLAQAMPVKCAVVAPTLRKNGVLIITLVQPCLDTHQRSVLNLVSQSRPRRHTAGFEGISNNP